MPYAGPVLAQLVAIFQVLSSAFYLGGPEIHPEISPNTFQSLFPGLL